MATATAPTINLAAGRAVLAEDLPRVLRFRGAEKVEDLDWVQPDGRTLLVPIHGTLDGKRERYTLKLQFMTGRDWPPSAQFVNPDTLAYEIPADQHHLPILGSTECQVHTRYNKPGGGEMQLICCSATLEFYEVLHDVEERHIWRPTDTFDLTIRAIERAIGSSHYKGRQPRHDG